MAESLESKLVAIMNALASLSHKTAEIEGVMAGLHHNGVSGIALSRVYQPQSSASEEAVLPSIRQDPVVLQRKEPRVSLFDKFDGARSKF